MRNSRLSFGFVLALVGLSLTAPMTGLAQEDKDGLTPNAHFMSGKLYFNQKVYEKSEREFAAAVLGDSSNAEYRAWWATALSQVATARLDATSSISELPARIEAVRAVAPLLASASAEFSRALELDPKKQADFVGDNLLHYWVDIYKEGENLLKDKRYEEALEIFRLTTVLDPKEPQGYFQVAYTHAQLGQTRESVQLAREVKAMAEVRIAELGDCSQFKSTKKKSECRSKIKSLNTIITNVDSFTRSKNAALGDDAYERGIAEKDPAARRATLDEAIGFYTAALEQDPALQAVRFNMGNCHFEKARSFEEAGDKPGAAASFLEGAGVFLVLADNDSADADLRRDALYNAASAYYSASKYPEAAPLFKRYIDLVPREVPAWKLAGSCLLEMGNRPEALSYMGMGNALSDKSVVTPVTESVGTVRNLYSSSAAATALSELGEPEEVKSFTDPTDASRIVTTWIWWSKGQARHFITGEEVGRVTFQAPAP